MVLAAECHPVGSALLYASSYELGTVPLETEVSYSLERSGSTDDAPCASTFCYHAFNTATVGPRITFIANRCRSTVKLPFPLTPQFKSMLQSGVGTRDLDVRWVSSLSWYFLTLFGLQPVYNFILGSNNGMYLFTNDHFYTNKTFSRQPSDATDGHGKPWCWHDGS